MLWETQLHQKTIPSTSSDAGIRLMTIHKAKGLEFSLVFFPYADRQIHSSTKEKLWLNTTSVLGDDFPLAWVNKSARVAHYGSEAAQRYFTKLKEEEVMPGMFFTWPPPEQVNNSISMLHYHSLKKNPMPDF